MKLVEKYSIVSFIVFWTIASVAFCQTGQIHKGTFSYDHYKKFSHYNNKDKQRLMVERLSGNVNSTYLLALTYLEEFSFGSYVPGDQAEANKLREMEAEEARDYCMLQNGMKAVALLGEASKAGHEDAALILGALYDGYPRKISRFSPTSGIRNSGFYKFNGSQIDSFGVTTIMQCYAKQYPGRKVAISEVFGAFHRYCLVSIEIYNSARQGEASDVLDWPVKTNKLESYRFCRRAVEINPNSPALFTVGQMEVEGSVEIPDSEGGSSQDVFERGLEKIILSGNLGNATACSYLAFKFSEGHAAVIKRKDGRLKLLEPNLEKSDYWIKKASALGAPFTIAENEYLGQVRARITQESAKIVKLEEEVASKKIVQFETSDRMLRKAGGVEKVKQRTEEVKASGRTLVFKNLYLRMPFEDALTTLKGILPDVVIDFDSDGCYRIALGSELIAFADREGFIRKFTLSRDTANKLFAGSEKLKWKEFAKQFVDGYKIRVPSVWELKRLKIYEDRKYGKIYAEYYEHNDPSGYRCRFMNLDEPDEHGGDGAMAVGLLTSLMGSALGDNSAFLLIEETPSQTNLKKVFN